MQKSYWLKSEIVSGLTAFCSGRISDCEKDSDSDNEMVSDPLMLSSASEAPDMVFELAPEGYAVQLIANADCSGRISDCEKDSDSDNEMVTDPLLLGGVDQAASMTFELLPEGTQLPAVNIEG